MIDRPRREFGGHRRKLLAAIAALNADSSMRLGRAASPVASKAERRQVTVMFVDLVKSTALAAALDPEDMQDLLRTYQNAVTGEIARLQGHVAKLMGDGVLAYFGWPTAHEDEAERAIRAGLAIVAAVPQIRAPAGRPLAPHRDPHWARGRGHPDR